MLDFSTLKKLTFDGVKLKKLTINGVQVWKGGFKNWVHNSLESGGATIYNGGLGYKKGYRIRSGGAEGAADNSICTGFIPFKIGDTLRIYPPFSGQNTQNALNFSDGNFTNLGQQCDNGTAYGICANNSQYYKAAVVNGVSTLTLNSPNTEIRYIRVTHFYNYNNNQSGTTVKQDVSNFIITVNEELEVPT